MQLISKNRRQKNIKQRKNVPGGSPTENILASYGNKRQKSTANYKQTTQK